MEHALQPTFLDSSIMEENLATRWVFVWMIELSDKNGVLDMTRSALARRIRVSRTQLDQAIDALSSPDPESRSAELEGRRIVLLDENRSWGWQVVNKRRYLTHEIQKRRRQRDREYQKNRRARSDGSDTSRPTKGDASAVLKSPDESRPTKADASAPPLLPHTPSSPFGGGDKSPPRRLTPAQRDLKAISDLFERFGATPLKGQQHGAWGKLLKSYREAVELRLRAQGDDEPDLDVVKTEGLTDLLTDLESCGEARHIAQRGKSYVLKIIRGLIDNRRTGQGIKARGNRARAQRVSIATIEAAALFDE